MTRPFADKPVLTGDRVVLRPFEAADVAAMTEVLGDEELVTLTGGHAPDLDEAQLAEWYGSRNAQPDRLDLAIEERASGACVGEAVLNEWDPDNRSCNFRIAIGAAGRGKGLGTEATRLIVGHGFEQLGLHRISLEVYAFNPRARRVYEKVGFVAEGVLRDVLRHGDEWVDSTMMSILSHEWPPRP